MRRDAVAQRKPYVVGLPLPGESLGAFIVAEIDGRVARSRSPVSSQRLSSTETL